MLAKAHAIYTCLWVLPIIQVEAKACSTCRNYFLRQVRDTKQKTWNNQAQTPYSPILVRLRRHLTIIALEEFELP